MKNKKNLLYALVAAIITLAVGGGVLMSTSSSRNLKGDLSQLRMINSTSNIKPPEDETNKRIDALEKRMQDTEAKLNCIKNIYYLNLTGNPNLVAVDKFITEEKKCLGY